MKSCRSSTSRRGQRAELENIAKEFKDLVGNEAAKIKGVLTAEQKETLQDLRADARSWFAIDWHIKLPISEI